MPTLVILMIVTAMAFTFWSAGRAAAERAETLGRDACRIAGVQLEDQGSTNGTYINGRRVVRGVARAGDEIGFDTVRFRLTASNQAEPAPEDVPERSAARRTRRWLVPALVIAAVVSAGAVALVLMR